MALVSIITPSYNSALLIVSTIQSVISQTFTDWEMIVVDDCSKDNSVEVIQSFVDFESRIKLIKLTENSGAAVARNTAIEAAQGRYIAFLDSDDVWLPYKLEKQIDFMLSNNYSFAYSAYGKINENNKVIGNVSVPTKVSYESLLKVNSIGCSTAIYDMSFFGKVYMPLIRKRQDLGLWLKLLKQTEYAFGIDETLAQYRLRPDSISANKIDAAKFTWHLYRNVENISLIKASYYFSHYAINGVLRTKFPRFTKLLGILK